MTMAPDRSTSTVTDFGDRDDVRGPRAARRGDGLAWPDPRGHLVAASGRRSDRVVLDGRSPGTCSRARGDVHRVDAGRARARRGWRASSGPPRELPQRSSFRRFEYLLPPASDLRPAAGGQQARIIAWMFTEAGYVGEDVESILTRLLQVCNYDVRLQNVVLYTLTKLIK